MVATAKSTMSGLCMRLQKGFGPIVCLGSVERQVFLAAKGDSVTIVAFLTALFATIETVVHVAMTIVITNVHYSFFSFFLSLFFFSLLGLDWIRTKTRAHQRDSKAIEFLDSSV